MGARSMHVNRGLLGWGIFFIALGAVPLAVQAGLLDAATARRAWELWPLLLVGIGLGLALRNTTVDALGGIIVALTFGLMGGGLVAGGFDPGTSMALCGTGGTSGSTDGASANGSLGPAASVELTVECGSLTATTGPGSAWSLSWPQGTSKPQVDDSSTRLRVAMGSQHGFGFGQSNARWSLVVPTDPSLGLSVSVNAGSAHLALGDAHVTTATASVNAGDARLDLRGSTGLSSITGSANAGSLSVALPAPTGSLTGSLTANAGSVDVCLPAGTAVRIRVGDNPLGSTNLAQRGFTQSGSTWTRGDAAAATRIDLDVSANLGSITIDPENGCG